MSLRRFIASLLGRPASPQPDPTLVDKIASHLNWTPDQRARFSKRCSALAAEAQSELAALEEARDRTLASLAGLEETIRADLTASIQRAAEEINQEVPA